MSGRQREYDVLLPVGHVDENGRLHKKAVIHKMRGHEEALLYDTTLSSAKLVTELIKGCLVRVGEMSHITSELVAQLYSADRNYLLVELRRITLGSELSSSYVCPSCGSEVAVVEDLGRIQVRRLDDGILPESRSVELEDGYQDREGVLHTSLRLRLPRGSDEEFVSRTAESDPLRARDALILRCIESFGTLPRAALDAYGIKILRDLTLGDRRLIYRALDDGPGVNFRRNVRCARCGVSFDAILEASSFFVLG